MFLIIIQESLIKKGEKGMRINRNIFWISSGISLFTLILSCFLSFMIKEENKATIFFCNIMENIFAGTIVLVITSMYEYYVSKKETLEDLLHEINHIKNLFSKLDYFDYRDFITQEEYEEYNKDRCGKESIGELYKIEKKKYLENKKVNFEKIIDEYINLANENFDSFWDKYNRIYFLFDKKGKKKNKIYNDFFKYIYSDKICKIRDAVIHFNEYKKIPNGNYMANKERLIKLQKEIFYFEDKKYLENGLIEKFDLDKTKSDFLCYELNDSTHTYYIYGNKITKHLDDFYDYIWRLTYKKEDNKKYNMN